MTGATRKLAMTACMMPALALALLAGCSAPRDAGNGSDNGVGAAAAAPKRNAAAPAPPAAPAAPGTPGGLADDRKPISEAPFAETSPQGAAQVVQTYFALIEARHYAEARRLWDRGGDASGKTEADFAADFGHYRDYHAEVGAPGRMEGAAGSSYVEVPVQLYGHLKDGSPFRQRAKVTLRRVNDVPGATEAQLHWHITDIAMDSGVDE